MMYRDMTHGRLICHVPYYTLHMQYAHKQTLSYCRHQCYHYHYHYHHNQHHNYMYCCY